jgi:hypothetical protein
MELIKNVDVQASYSMIEKEMKEVYGRWKKAIMTNDLKFLENFYSDDFTSTTGAGIIKNKSEVLTRLRFKDVGYLTWEDKNILIDIKGDNAVLKSCQTLDIELYGLPIKIDREIMLTLYRGDNSWVLKDIREKSV